MSGAIRYLPQHTVADYEHWEGDWELWSGVPVSMSPSPGVPHQNVNSNLVYLFRDAVAKQEDCHCRVLFEIDWRIDHWTVVRPDLMMVCEPITTNWIEVTPTVVVEILSPTTAEKDRGPKRDLYAQQGVAWYIMADPDTKTLEILRLAGDAYEPVSPETQITLHDGCSVSLDPAVIWEQ